MDFYSKKIIVRSNYKTFFFNLEKVHEFDNYPYITSLNYLQKLYNQKQQKNLLVKILSAIN